MFLFFSFLFFYAKNKTSGADVHYTLEIIPLALCLCTCHSSHNNFDGIVLKRFDEDIVFVCDNYLLLRAVRTPLDLPSRIISL